METGQSLKRFFLHGGLIRQRQRKECTGGFVGICTLKTEESQTPDVTTDDIPMEVDLDTVTLAITSDNTETQPVEMSVMTTY